MHRQTDTAAGSLGRTLRGLWGRGLRSGLDLLFSPECAHCQTPLEPGTPARLCEACVALFCQQAPACARCGCQLHSADDPAGCRRCAEEKWNFIGVTRLGLYEGALRSAVLQVKRPHDRALAVALGELLAQRLSDATLQVDAVLPVPMHWTRRLWRGANSPETIAGCVAARLSVPAAGHLLVRSRRTAPQASLSPRGRRQNVRGAFRVRSHPDLAGARLLMIDDIMTTGATLNETARCLLKAGAQSVHVAVIARAEGVVA